MTKEEAERLAREYLEAHLDPGEQSLAALLLRVAGEAIRTTSHLCAEHVRAQSAVTESGMPGFVALAMVAKTFESEDWFNVVRAAGRAASSGEKGGAK